MFYKIVRAIFIPLTGCLLPTRVIGKKNIPPKGTKLIVVCNHQNSFEVPKLACILPFVIRYMGKSEMFESKTFTGRIWAWFVRKIGAYPVVRGTPDMNAIKHTLQIIKKGEVPGIFPQGTRVDTGAYIDREQVFSGVSLLALKGKADLLPVMFPTPPRFFRPCTMIIGEKLEVAKYLDKRVTAELIEELTDELVNKMNKLLDDYYAQHKK